LQSVFPQPTFLEVRRIAVQKVSGHSRSRRWRSPMIGFGYFKGMYDANIWASLHNVVKPERRATVVGVMNSIGWLGGGAGARVIGVATPVSG